MDQKTIRRIALGSASSWIYGVSGKWMLIDTGAKLTSPYFWDALAKGPCTPEDFSLLVLTHAHFDHVGVAGKMKKRTGVPIALHEGDAEVLAHGRFVISNGFNFRGRVKAYVARHLLNKAYVSFDAVEADILFSGERRLDEYGFPAAVVPTPGHSDASVSVLSDDGDWFSGDAAINRRKRTDIWRHMSDYGTSRDLVKSTWRAMLERGAKVVHPGHGDSFPADELRKFL